MKAAHKIIFMIGAIFTFVGTCILIPFSTRLDVYKSMIFIPLFFVIMGICFMLLPLFAAGKKWKIKRFGTRYAAKIYGYAEDTSVLVNGSYPVNTVVHYFDENGTEREAILETGFAKGSGAYPLGMTIDIYEYNGKFSWDAASVRNEEIPREAELLDDQPVKVTGLETFAMECKGCGASFTATKGFVGKCPYCGRFIDAQTTE